MITSLPTIDNLIYRLVENHYLTDSRMTKLKITAVDKVESIINYCGYCGNITM